MSDKTIRDLKKTLSEIFIRYQEYKEVVSHLKQIINEQGETITDNKLEIFALKKNGYYGPPEDEVFFRICHAMQTKLLETHTEAYYKDFDKFEKVIEQKLRTMDTDLQHLQRMSGACWKQPDPVRTMSELVKKKESEIAALKQERDQVLKQTGEDQLQISTLEQKLKQAKEKIWCLKQTLEKEQSTCKHILKQLHQTKGECKVLDSKLKMALEDNEGLQEKYRSENRSHKDTQDSMKRLQEQFLQTAEEKNRLQSKYQSDKCKIKKMKEAMNKSIEELRIRVKETAQEHKCLEKSFEKEKCLHKTTKESLDQVVEELQGQLKETLKENKDLQGTREELEQILRDLDRVSAQNQVMAEKEGELQVRLQNTTTEMKVFKESYEHEKSQHKNTREELEQILQVLDCVKAEHGAMAQKVEELGAQLKRRTEEFKALQENYQQEKSQHQTTRGALEQSVRDLERAHWEHQDTAQKEEELRVQLQNTVNGKKTLEESYQQERSQHGATRGELEQTRRDLERAEAAGEELRVQLGSTLKEKKVLEENYEQEKSEHKNSKEMLDHIIKELNHVNSENQAMAKTEKELQAQLKKKLVEKKGLEEVYEQEKIQHQNTREELEQSIEKLKCNIVEELQAKLRAETEKNSSLEEKLLKTLQELQEQQSSHRTTQEELAQKIGELQLRLQQAADENEDTKEWLNQLEEVYEKEKSEHQNAKEELQQWAEKAEELQEIYCREKSDLENMTAKAEKLILLLKQAVEKNQYLEMNLKQQRSAHKSTRKSLEQVKNHGMAMTDKLLQVELQLQQALDENEFLQENHLTEMSALQLQLQQVLEDLDQARSQKKVMEAKLEETERLVGREKTQLQAREKQFTEDLQACLSVISDSKNLKQRLLALKRCYLEKEHAHISEVVEHGFQLENRDLSKRLHGCENLLKVNSVTISRLEQKLSGTLQLCDERERKYVQLLNSHLVKEHRLRKELEQTLQKLEKVSKRIPQKVSLWWQEKVLKNTLESPPEEEEEEEEQINLYPEDWRLPGFPKDEKSLNMNC